MSAGGRVAADGIVALPADAESFAPFGRVFKMRVGEQEGVVVTEGLGWSDAYTGDPITRETPSLGMTVAPGLPYECTQMERHRNVEEALMPGADALVLTVAEASESAPPRAEHVRAFVIEPGTVVVLRPGVWHDACRGVAGPTAYYWLASCVDSGSSPWTQLEGGPVNVEVAA